MYIVFGLCYCAASLASARIGSFQLSPLDAWIGGSLIVAAVGGILRKPWGRWGCYFFSVLLLPGIPLGTIMGGFMIYYLKVYRDQFRPGSAIPNPRTR